MLIPHVSLVVFDAVASEQFAEFVLERLLAMMPTLVTNVISQIVQVRLANRKRAVSVLPGECAEFISLCFDPFGRARFDFFYEVANRNRSTERASDMDVIVAAA